MSQPKWDDGVSRWDDGLTFWDRIVATITSAFARKTNDTTTDFPRRT